MSGGGVVTFVVKTLVPRRGMENALLRLAAALAGTREVRILVLEDPGDDRPEGVEVTSLAGARPWTAYRELRRHLRSRRPDESVVVVGLWTAMRLWVGARFVLRDAVVWEHSLTSGRVHGGPRFRLKAEVGARAYARCARIVVVSEAVSETLEREWGLGSVVIPNLMDLPDEAPGRRARERAGRDSGEPKQPARLLAVGAAKPVKNYDLLLRALAQVTTPWTLQMAGGGPLQESLQALAESLGIGDRVEWLGDVRDVPARMAAADLLVHPAASETFGYVLLEAAEQWLPVVVRDAPVMNRLVPGLVPGVLCEPEEASLASAVEGALAREGVWDFANADRLRREQFSARRTLEAWARVLGDVVPAGREA